MSRRLVAASGAVMFFAAVSACAAVAGLGDYDIKDDEAGTSDGQAFVDGQLIGDGGGADAPEPCVPKACPASPPPPAGFARVVFVDGLGCPSGHDSIAAIEAPNPNSGACGCGVCSTGGVDCAKGIVTSSFDNGGGLCGNPGVQTAANDGGCFNQDISIGGPNARVNAPQAVVGSCTAPGIPVRSNVATSARTICVLSANACPGSECPVLTGQRRSCLMANDTTSPDAGCPATMEKHVVGADFTLTCDACGCTPIAICDGRMAFFNTNNCNGSPNVTIDAGACNPTSQPGSIKSRRWIGKVAAESCMTQPNPPTIDLVQKRTICCGR